ncbi:MAG: KH domain-containing protein [Clostridia bacterium]
MIELIEFIVKELVTDKDKVVVTSADSESETVITIRVDEKDVGKIIGRQGKIAMAIRTIAKAVGIKEGKRYTVEIED